MKKVSEEDEIFIMEGTDGEIYLIDSPALILELEQKVEELSKQGFDEATIARHLLPLVNPQKYG